MTHHLHHTLKPFQAGARQGQFHSLLELAKTDPNVNRLPVSIRMADDAAGSASFTQPSTFSWKRTHSSTISSTSAPWLQNNQG